MLKHLLSQSQCLTPSQHCTTQYQRCFSVKLGFYCWERSNEGATIWLLKWGRVWVISEKTSCRLISRGKNSCKGIPGKNNLSRHIMLGKKNPTPLYVRKKIFHKPNRPHCPPPPTPPGHCLFTLTPIFKFKEWSIKIGWIDVGPGELPSANQLLGEKTCYPLTISLPRRRFWGSSYFIPTHKRLLNRG